MNNISNHYVWITPEATILVLRVRCYKTNYGVQMWKSFLNFSQDTMMLL